MNPRGFVGRICLPFCWVPWSSSTCSGLESGAEGRAPPPPQRRFTGAHSGLDPTVAWTPSGLDPIMVWTHRGLDPTVVWTPPWSGPPVAWTPPWSGPHSGLDPTVVWTHRGLDPQWPGPPVAWTPPGSGPHMAWTHSGLDTQWPGPRGWSRWLWSRGQLSGQRFHLFFQDHGPWVSGS